MEALQKRILGLAQNQYNEGENEVDFVGQLLHFYRQQTERSVYQKHNMWWRFWLSAK